MSAEEAVEYGLVDKVLVARRGQWQKAKSDGLKVCSFCGKSADVAKTAHCRARCIYLR